MQPGFTILEHPSDLGIEARGETLAGAFEAVARGLMSVLREGEPVRMSETRKISLRASDEGQLLVRWLGEILYLYDGRNFVPGEFLIREITDVSLRAVLRGETVRAERRGTALDVKAVTYHQLEVGRDEQGVFVRVFLDI